MKFKKRLSLLLALPLLLTLLCGCGNSKSLRNDDDNDRPSSSKPKDDPTNPDGSDDTTKPVNKIQMDEISSAGTFVDGYAFVERKNKKDIIYCINKKGEIQFQLDNFQSYTRFHNGYSFVTDKSGTTYLCNTSGKKIYAEDFGCTNFISRWHDDFILIVNSVSDFSGSTDSLGILNYELEFIVSPSEDLYELFEPYYNDDSTIYNTSYFAGHLYNEKSCLNLFTGEENTDLNTMYQNAQVEYPSDLWEYLSYPSNWADGATYKDNKTGQTAVDLRQYKETINRAYEFEDGTASLLFLTDSAIERKNYFGVIDENGEFLFDPIELPKITRGEYFVTKDGDYYLLQSSFMAYETEYTIVLINKNGVSKQISIQSSRYLYVYIGDGVLLVVDQDKDYNSTYTYCTLEMEPLF